MLGVLKRSFLNRDPILWKKLYTSLVRPNLEYASAVWNALSQFEANELEKVQRRATKIPKNFYKMCYEERLKSWGLTSLETRRRGDLIQMYKALNGIEKINWHTGPTLAPRSQTRAASTNETRLLRESFPTSDQNDYCHFTNVRHNFFLNRVTTDWNNLSNTQVGAISVNSFKSKIDSPGP